VTAWPEPVERVAAFLRAAGAEARLEEFADATPTARDAARAVGCELQQIVKSIVILCDGRAVVVLVPGDRRADVARIGRVLECGGARVATPQEVLDATGFEPGAVAPFPLPRVHRVLLERTLLAHEIVWVGAGSARHMAGLEPGELVRLSRATPIHATE
jgi:prolyl-tRNA editing enzyme YbaK/EbsC (Cys-tRNA(Pro) deacylase)